MAISRQVRRATARATTKFNSMLARGFINEAGKSRLQMNPSRKKIFHGMTVAIANSMEIPTDVPAKDKLSYAADQRHLAWTLNSEFIQRANGKGGKKAQGIAYIKSIATQRDHTNPIGYFA